MGNEGAHVPSRLYKDLYRYTWCDGKCGGKLAWFKFTPDHIWTCENCGYERIENVWAEPLPLPPIERMY